MTAGRAPAAALGGTLIAAAWAAYLPLGLQYTAFLSCVLLALTRLVHEGRAAAVLRHPVFLAALALWAWLAASAAWTHAPVAAVVSHLWMYSLPLGATVVALTATRSEGRAALQHFVAASSVAAAAVLADAGGLLPDALSAWTSAGVSGNQRIAHSLLLALGAALAALQAVDATRPAIRGVATGAAVLCLAGLIWQDRRTGMLAAPLLLTVLTLVRQRSVARRVLLLLLIGGAVVATWQASDHVRQRFDEGVAELRAYRSDGEVNTSWGMRARMLEVTTRMVMERPWTGHGVGSWVTEWRRRVAGSEALEAHTTPHNEYLLLAVQGGAVALLLALLLWACVLRAIAGCGRAGAGPLLVLVALTCAAFFNVVLRDAKFAVPLLSLAALAWSAGRPPAGAAGLADAADLAGPAAGRQSAT